MVMAFALWLTSSSLKENAVEPPANPEPSSEAAPTVTEETKTVCTLPSVKNLFYLINFSGPRPRLAPRTPRRKSNRRALPFSPRFWLLSREGFPGVPRKRRKKRLRYYIDKFYCTYVDVHVCSFLKSRLRRRPKLQLLR